MSVRQTENLTRILKSGKEKEIIKIQVNLWKSDELKKKIYKINDVEGLIKLNSANSLNVVLDFIVNY